VKSHFQESISIPDLSKENQANNPSFIDSVLGRAIIVDASEREILLNEIYLRGIDCVWLKVEQEDRDPGRFWLKFVAGLRKYHPECGKELLSGLIDHHSLPNHQTLLNLSKELRTSELIVVLENIQFLCDLTGWHANEEWLNQSFNRKWVGILTKNENLHLPMNTLNSTDQEKQELFSSLSVKNEWLEYIHLLLLEKEFETAGEILEEQGESWLEDGFDPLEMLFWLREIPSVLLNARPILCWLAANACKRLDLAFLMNYYKNAAENSLVSLSRFSRDPQKWQSIELNETGLTIGELMNKLNQIK